MESKEVEHDKKCYEYHRQKYLKLQEQFKNEQDKAHDSTREYYQLLQKSDKVTLTPSLFVLLIDSKGRSFVPSLAFTEIYKGLCKLKNKILKEAKNVHFLIWKGDFQSF